MANLPEGISTLGPVYLPTPTKELYIKCGDIEGKQISTMIKESVIEKIKKHFPAEEVKI
jgi:hypothetical protein